MDEFLQQTIDQQPGIEGALPATGNQLGGMR